MIKIGTKRYWQSCAVMFLVTTTFILSTAGAFAHTTDSKPGMFHSTSHLFIFPPNSRPYGRTYGEWSNAWFQWALSIPTPKNPVIDTTGANCSKGQSGKVWFLAGTSSGGTLPPVPSQVTRSCTIPAGKALFFPIVNTEADNTGCPFTNFTVAQLRQFTNSFIANVTTLKAEIDGVNIKHLRSFRAGPNNPPFKVTLPADNIPSHLFCTPPNTIPAGTYFPAVSDGYYLMVAPLSAGQHTIHFEAKVSSNLTENVTYKLTVKQRCKI